MMSLATIPIGNGQIAPPYHAPLAPARFTFAELDTMSEAVVKSNLFPGITSKQAALALMLLCDADGLHPMDAMRRYHIIEGRPSMRADTMQAEFQRRGGFIEWHQYDATVADATLYHPKHAPNGVRVTITMADLTARGLTGGANGMKKNYRNHPGPMLRARLITEGVRMVDPSVVVGIYTPEEIEDFAGGRDDEPRPIGATASARLASRLAPPEPPAVRPETPAFDVAVAAEIATGNAKAEGMGLSRGHFNEPHALNSLANYLIAKGKLDLAAISIEGSRDLAKTRDALNSFYLDKPKPTMASLRVALEESIAKAASESQEPAHKPENASQVPPTNASDDDAEPWEAGRE